MDETFQAITIYVDADACPVKAEIYRVAERHGLKVFVVSNSFFQVPQDPLIERVVVSNGFDAADDWIAERAGRGAVGVRARHLAVLARGPARALQRERGALNQLTREIRAAELCTLEQVEDRCADFTARRIRAALGSLAGTGPAYTESGRP